MDKKEILIIGFQPYTEKMYPHLYEVLQEMEQYFQVRYFGNDKRGYEWINLCRSLRLTVRDLLTPKKLIYTIRDVLSFLQAYYRNLHALRKMIGDNLHAIIAIDHSALNAAAEYASSRTKLVFWSHDIISSDTFFYNCYFIRRIIRQNIRNIRKFGCIIIQDYARSALLNALLFSHSIPKFYLPISLRDDHYAQQVARDKANKVHLQHINLMQQNFSEERGSDVLVAVYQTFDDYVTLLFQSSTSSTVHTLLGLVERKPVLYPLQESLSTMREHIAQSDIGFICYQVQDLNHAFLSHASGQLVEFLRFGIPVVVFKAYELGQFVETYHAGVYINDITTLREAIEKIRGKYAEYSLNARQLYEKQFNLTLYLKKLIILLYKGS